MYSILSLNQPALFHPAPTYSLSSPTNSRRFVKVTPSHPIPSQPLYFNPVYYAHKSTLLNTHTIPTKLVLQATITNLEIETGSNNLLQISIHAMHGGNVSLSNA